MKNVEVRYLEENEFETWDEFVDDSPQGSIFCKSYWLKAVTDEFRILVCLENNKIIGGLPLPSVYNKFYRSPKLTPRLGIILSAPDKTSKYTNNISKEMEIVGVLIDSIPKFKQFDYNFSNNYNNFLPLIWEGFKVCARYTYIIEDLTDVQEIYDNLHYNCKRSIKKAINSNLVIIEENNIEEFYNINKKTFNRQGIEIPYSFEFLSRLDKTLEDKNSRKMIFAKNENGDFVAAVYLIYDAKCTYYLMGGADPEYRNTGVQKLLLWEGIKFAASVSKIFDFEGSMIPNIEKVFREFGAKQTIIYNVYKSDAITDLLYGFARKNRELFRRIFRV